MTSLHCYLTEADGIVGLNKVAMAEEIRRRAARHSARMPMGLLKPTEVVIAAVDVIDQAEAVRATTRYGKGQGGTYTITLGELFGMRPDVPEDVMNAAEDAFFANEGDPLTSLRAAVRAVLNLQRLQAGAGVAIGEAA